MSSGLRISTHLLTYSMEQRSSCKANQFSASKKFPAFYWTRRFITAFTSASHLSLSWASSIQSVPPHPTSWRSILILSSHLRLGLPSGLFPSCFPTKILYTPVLSPIRLLVSRASKLIFTLGPELSYADSDLCDSHYVRGRHVTVLLWLGDRRRNQQILLSDICFLCSKALIFI